MRSAGWSGIPPPLRHALVGCALLVGLAALSAALLAPGPAGTATTVVAFVSEVTAAAACFWSARHAAVDDRRWRVLIGMFAAGLAGGALLTTVILLNGDTIRSAATSAFLGLIAFYGLALAGLLYLPTYPVEGRSARGRDGGLNRWHVIVVLDSLLIVGSVLLFEWGTSLAAIVRASSPDPAQLLVALVHQLTALVLATAVLLIATFRRPRSPATLALLGGGLLGYALTNSINVYRYAHGHYDLPAWSLMPLIVSLQLITLAALAPASAAVDRNTTVEPGPRAMWAHTALPYAVLAVTGLVPLGKLVAGVPLNPVEAYGAVSLLVLAFTRQMITLAENTRLLAEVREREKQLNYQAFHDPLTGLANRALFARRLRHEVDPGTEARGGDTATGGQAAVSVLFVDLDQFKRVNDTFGHAIGDELLKITAARLRAGTRANDLVARLGGDEFAVILDGSGPDDPVHVAQRLAITVQTPCQLAGQTFQPRASLGLVTLDPDTWPMTPDSLLHQADLAMYAAKRADTTKLVIYNRRLGVHPGRDPPQIHWTPS
ncbi:GGDEF domain-containing protein [Frankia sp. CcI49]|uniref:GGDEF domain-containing protein n=1 Tax=unclassified Frankia TaxID=2632575 RepID=UPI0006DA7DBA|nr:MULTISPECIES: GGDEF domain-containing protein [unclassified Frankia]KPM54090.1 diguanylate cyclase [Frankia sp. R43]ONH61514.1 GGDEF domain-containing protein [Frankia sp. CcI49]